jgi:cyclohexanone monooxygenase
VVGAGFAGLYMVQRLREAGLSVQGFEAGKDVGGTWYWNRYPGARCDIPSLLYSYTWSDEVRLGWRWSEKYATQPEILSYAEHVADRYDLRRDFAFETRVTSAVFDEASRRWTVRTDAGDVIDARFCIMATGCLSVPRGADLPGADSFKGESYVTGLWPHEGVDFKGKRVAVIGTGSSAIQSLPLIAKDAAHVTVFQRTPNFSLPAVNTPLADEEVAAFHEAFPEFIRMVKAGEPGIPMPPADWIPNDEELAQLVEGLWSGWGLIACAQIPNLLKDERINEAACEFVRGKIREIVKDPALAEKLVPRDFPLAAKRACVDTDYFATFNRDNVSLVDLRETAIEAITPTGVKTADGEYPNLPWPHGGGLPQPVHGHRTGQPVGAVEHADVDRVPRRLDRRRHRSCAGQAGERHRGDGAGPGRLGRARQRGGRQDPLSARRQLVHRGQCPRKAARLHALRRRGLQSPHR